MRNIVEHGQISGSSDTTVRSGCSFAMRWTMWISVATPRTAPGPAASTHSRMRSVDPTRSASSHHLVRGLGVHDDLAVGVVGPELGDVLGREPLVDRAVALPEEEGRLLHVGVVEAAQLEARVPQPHVGRAVAHLERGVAAEVLVGEERDLVAAAERPLEDGPRVRRRADGAAVLADERLDGRRGVHVRDRHDPVDVGDGRERLPALLDLVEVGHVGHGAPGVEVGEDHPLVVAGEDVGRLRHEVDAAEDDVGGAVGVGREPGEVERVAAGVGPADDLVALVVVAEDDQAVAQGLLGSADAVFEHGGLGRRVLVGQPGLESQHGLGSPYWDDSRYGRRGQPGRPPRGCRSLPLGTGSLCMWPEYQAGLRRA